MKYPRALLLLFFFAVTGCGGGGGGGDSQAFGLDARATPSSVQIPTGVGSGSSGPVTAVDVFPNVRLQGPSVITHAGDGSGRLFVMQRDGLISVINNGGTASQATTFLDIRAKVFGASGESGTLGLTFDPAFTTNGYFYVSYAALNPLNWRLSRFKVSSGNPNVADPASERIILEFAHPNGYHYGGWIGFGPDGMLYASSGDGGNEMLPQDTTSPFGKVLRLQINANGSYTVPPDNPFGTYVWARGFRNPWRCSFDRAGNGNLWCGDVGESSREEINRVKKGANYGWPVYEGSLSTVNPNNLPYSAFEPAIYQYPHEVGVAVIGGYVYRGSAMSALVGRYLYMDYVAGKLWAIETDANGNFVSNTEVADGLGTVHALGEDQNGEVFMAGQQGAMLRIAATGSPGPAPTMPATLSATGLFSDLAQMTPSPGVIDYEVNAPFWSDGARKQRWFVLPGNATIAFAANGAWTFPIGTITVKHFELPLAAGGTTRVETRVMVYRASGWTGYTYRWRPDQTDADLLSSGASATYQTINPATNAPTTLTWNFPSSAQCLQCHTEATGRVLGLNTRQFNGNHTYATTGRSDNQLRTLNHIGIFSNDIGAASQYGAMPNPTDTSVALESRAKAWLDTNCSICHLPGGPTPVAMDLRYATAVADMQLLGVANQGSVSGVRVVVGNHSGSLLWQRATSTAANVRMPPLGVQMVDETGLQLLASWIDALQ